MIDGRCIDAARFRGTVSENYLITLHAAERYVKRVRPDLDVERAREILLERMPSTAPLKERSVLGHEQRRLAEPDSCVVVVKRDREPNRVVVVTVFNAPFDAAGDSWIRELLPAAIGAEREASRAQSLPFEPVTPTQEDRIVKRVLLRAADRLTSRLAEIERLADRLDPKVVEGLTRKAEADARAAEARLAVEAEKTRRQTEMLANQRKAAEERLERQRLNVKHEEALARRVDKPCDRIGLKQR